MFSDWAVKRHGSAAAALKAWDGLRLPEDTDGRFGFRPLCEIFTHRTPRDRDTAEFLFETQNRFYRDQVAYLRQLGFKGLITASNWTTANNRILGPLEKLSYLSGDFIDRHGYFAGQHEGPDAAWSVKPGQVFSHRSSLRFDPPKPGEPPEVSHPAFDTKIGDKPSMISETTYNRPNRHRVEAPAYYAIYGALQGSDAIVHFALDGTRWDVKPNFWMQPWTLMSPTQMGQFPAAALVYRQGLVKEGDLMADIHLLVAMDGKPLASSSRMLLQVMSEEQTTGFTTEPAGKGTHRIVAIGKNPWRIRPIQGQVELLRPDASHLRTPPLDANGRPAGEPTTGATISFAPSVAYYLIEAKEDSQN